MRADGDLTPADFADVGLNDRIRSGSSAVRVFDSCRT